MTKSECIKILTKLIKDDQERLDKYDWGMSKGHIEYCQRNIEAFKFAVKKLKGR